MNASNQSNYKRLQVQVVDLIDIIKGADNGSFIQNCYEHTFLTNLCSLRDLIFWFQQERYVSTNSTSLQMKEDTVKYNNSKLSISRCTETAELIQLFQQNKWHLVILPVPGTTQSPTRLFSKHLDKHLNDLLSGYQGVSRVRMLAIIGRCPGVIKNEVLKSQDDSSEVNYEEVGSISGCYQLSSQDKSIASMTKAQQQHTNRSNDQSSTIQSISRLSEVQVRVLDLTEYHLSYIERFDPRCVTLNHIMSDVMFKIGIDSQISSPISTPFDYQYQRQHQQNSKPDFTWRLMRWSCKGTWYPLIMPKNAAQNMYRPLSEILQEDPVANAYTDDIIYESRRKMDQLLLMLLPTKGLELAKETKELFTVGEYQMTTSLGEFNSNTNSSISTHVGTTISGSGIDINNSISSNFNNIMEKSSHSPSPKLVETFFSPLSLTSLAISVLLKLIQSFNQETNDNLPSIYKLPSTTQQTLIQQLSQSDLLCDVHLKLFCTPQSRLTNLDLSYNSLITDDSLLIIGQSFGLEELVLDNDKHKFTDDGIWNLYTLKNLRRLSLGWCNGIGDAVLQMAEELPRLTGLCIRGTKVTLTGIVLFCKSLERTRVASCKNSNLTSLDIGSLNLIDDSDSATSAARQLATALEVGCPNLETLILAGTHVGNDSQWWGHRASVLLPRLPRLLHLDISACAVDANKKCLISWEGQEDVRALSVSCSRLQSIAITVPVSTADRTLALAVLAASRLRYLRQEDGLLRHPGMTAGLALCLTGHLPLRTVVLTGCSHVTDAWLPPLARLADTLVHLVLSYCNNITGANSALETNLSYLHRLRWLDISHLATVPLSQIAKIVLDAPRHFPKLQVIWISPNNYLDDKRNIVQSLPFTIHYTETKDNQEDNFSPILEEDFSEL